MEEREWMIKDVSDTSLDEDDLYDVVKDLIPLAAKWKEIGIALRLRIGELDKIDAGRPNMCLSEVIANWLKKNYNTEKFGLPTWRWLVEVVADPAAGNDRALAEVIARKHYDSKDYQLSCNSTDQCTIPEKPKISSHDTTPEKRKTSSHHRPFKQSNIYRVLQAPPMLSHRPKPSPPKKPLNTRVIPRFAADVSILVEEPWYHGDISWEDAEERLNAQDSDCFLVRKSQSQPGKYVLSVSYGGVVNHFPVCKEDQHYEVEGTENPFTSLSELVAFYKNHFLSPDEEMLTTHCPRPRLTPRKNFTLIKGMHMSKENEAIPPVSQSSPKHSPWLSISYRPPSPPDSPIQGTQELIVVDSVDDEEPQPPRLPPRPHHKPCYRPIPKPRRPRIHQSYDQTNPEGDTLSDMASLSISAESSQLNTSSESDTSRDTH